MTDASSRQKRVELTHLDGLDGLRGLAVAAVVLYHCGVSWAKGGLLGVEVFFVLSGFLITSLLVREWLGTGTVILRNFWARRGRRLLPALFVVVTVIGIYYAIKGSMDQVPGLLGDGISALFYYSNWHQIANGTNYFASQTASPFQHTWSLSIEEQFYVVWPLLVLTLAWVITRKRSSSAGPPSDREAIRWLDLMLGLAVVLLIGSAIDCLALFHGGAGRNRVYFGTDTHATGLLAGAGLAVFMARIRLSGHLAAGSIVTGSPPAVAGHDVSAGRDRFRLSTPVASLLSGVAVAGILVMMARVSGTQDNWLYPWGFLLTDALSISVIAAILMVPRSIANRVFSLAPARGLGKISYGVYLWHFPLILWLLPSGHLVGWKLNIVRILAALAISIASYFLIEQPIRQRRLPVWWVRGLAPVAVAAGIVALVVANSADQISTKVTTAQQITANAGHQNCQLSLANTTYTGEVAPPVADESKFQLNMLDRGAVTWPAASTTKTFHTCNPTPRAMVIGDSIAFTESVPYLYNDQDYGMAVSNAATLGCAFGTKGELDVDGTWEAPPKECPGALAQWEQEANAFGANEIIFELGYRDEFNWMWSGTPEHLGDPEFDSYVEGRIKQYVKVLGEGGKRKLLFLTIPFVDAHPFPDGTPAPQDSPARHTQINQLITEAANSAGSNAEVLDVDKVLSPSGHYQGSVPNPTTGKSELCRFDGIHVTVYCATLLEPHVLDTGRALLKK